MIFYKKFERKNIKKRKREIEVEKLKEET